MMMPVTAAAMLMSLGPQSIPSPQTSADSYPVFLIDYQQCLVGMAVVRARTSSMPTAAILDEAFAACANGRRAAREGGVVGDDPKVSEALLTRFDERQRTRLIAMIETNRVKPR